MSNSIDLGQLEGAVERVGCGWMLQSDQKDEYLRGIAQDIEEFRHEYRKLFGHDADPFQLLEKNPQAGSAFLKLTCGSRITLRMRILVWKLLLGAEIRALRIDYKRGQAQPFRFEVTLLPRGKTEEEMYPSIEPWDFRVIHYIQMMTLGDEAVLTGLPPL
jgi:hypothetical protein